MAPEVTRQFQFDPAGPKTITSSAPVSILSIRQPHKQTLIPSLFRRALFPLTDVQEVIECLQGPLKCWILDCFSSLSLSIRTNFAQYNITVYSNTLTG